MEEYERLKKEKAWIEDYIPMLEEEKIVWKLLDAKDMDRFLEENYFEEDVFLGFPSPESGEWIPFGLTNTTFSSSYSFHYLLSYIENKKGKKTILTCLCYILDFKTVELDQEITFLLYVETNSFYQGKGLFKATLKKFKNFPVHPYLLVTHPTYDGIVCHTVEYLKEVMQEREVEVFENIYEIKKSINKRLTK